MVDMLTIIVIVATLASGLACLILLWEAFERDEERVKRIRRDQPHNKVERELSQQEKRKEHPTAPQIETEMERARIAYMQAVQQYKIVHERAVEQHMDALRQYRDKVAALEKRRFDSPLEETIDSKAEQTQTVRTADDSALAGARQKVARRAETFYESDKSTRETKRSIRSAHGGGVLHGGAAV